METEAPEITNPSEIEGEQKRKKYSPLPDDAPRNKINRKARPKLLTKAVLIYMSPKDMYSLRVNAEKAGFPSYSSYVRFLGNLIVNEDSLIVNISKRAKRNLMSNAEDAGMTMEEYVKFLCNLKVQVQG